MSTEESKALIARMYEAMNLNRVGVMEEFWTAEMAWRGPAGIGTTYGVADFEQKVRAPMIRAFPQKVGIDEIRIAEGEYVAAMGHQHAHQVEAWLGIPATANPIKMRYMDFWRIEQHDGEPRLAENWVLIDILGVLEQAGYNVEKVLKFVGSQPPEFFEAVE
jgi:predicted ester cyclase